MSTLYKLTDQDYKTRTGYDNETLWGPNVEHSAKGDAEQDLCSDGWLHAYTDPLLAVLLDPMHANISCPILWEAEGEVGKSDGCKVGCRTLRTVRIIPLPEITTEQRVRFAILCAKRVCADEKWNSWADAWLNDKNRPSRAETWAATISERATSVVTWAEGAAWAATLAERAAREERAAEAAAYVARAAEAAAYAAAWSGKNIDLSAIVKLVLED